MDTLRNNDATPPDRLNEDWRFGQPHVHAADLLRLLASHPGDAGFLSHHAPSALTCTATAPGSVFPAIGSGYLVQQALGKPMQSLSLSVAGHSAPDSPLTLTCDASGLFLASICITIEPGTHAHIIERHIHHGASTLICLRHYTILPGATLSLELQEEGSGDSRALNISHITCSGRGTARHLTTHSSHIWAREETTAELTGSEGDLLLLSANRLHGSQQLDQRTVQRHTTPGAKSRLLYKNVLDDHASAIFGGNIRVEPAAHDTDAYLSNLNLMLSERATMHSLPGLEILADRVRCSHGSATAPMDPEQLFYLLARGISEPSARTLLADGFLSAVHSQFRA